MQIKHLIIILIISSFKLVFAITPMEVITKLDANRGVQNKSFSMSMEVVQVKNKVRGSKTKLISYVDTQSISNSWNTLVKFLAPTKRKGQLILLEKNRMWFYKPGTKRAIRISPTQRLLGEASNADVVGMNYREYYSVDSMTTEKIGKIDTYFLKLKKKKNFAPYDHVGIWVEKKKFYPVKAEFFSRSGKKLKVAYYRKLKKILGKFRITEVVIVDGINVNNLTYINMSSMKIKSIKSSFYNPKQLVNANF